MKPEEIVERTFNKILERMEFNDEVCASIKHKEETEAEEALYDYLEQQFEAAITAERERVLREFSFDDAKEAIESLIGVAKTYAIQTIDRHGVTAKTVKAGEDTLAALEAVRKIIEGGNG